MTEAKVSEWYVLLLAVLCPAAQAQYGEWTWMGGSTQEGRNGIYGTLGTSAPVNAPGSRWNAVEWTDKQGKLWLFGGYGLSTGTAVEQLNDLWRFDPSTNQWTWMAGSNQPDQPGVYGTLGSPSPTNIPGARSGASAWTDQSGNCGYSADTELAFRTTVAFLMTFGSSILYRINGLG